MADFSKFKIGNTSYNVKDAAAGKSLSVNGTDLSLKNAAGNTISTVTLPGGSGKFVWFDGMSSSNSMSIEKVVDETGATISTFQAMRMAANTGAYVFLVDGAFDADGAIYALTSIEKVQGSLPIEYTITFSGKDGKWVGQCADTADITTLTLNFTANGGGGGVDISPIAIAVANSWPGQPTSLSAPTGKFTLSDHFAIQIQDFNQPPMPYVKSVLATGFTIDGYGSVTEFFNQHYSAGASFSIIAWFVVDMNHIVKATASCIYDGNGEYTVSSVSATTATAVGA